MELVLILIIGVVLWYAGSHINSMLQGAAESAAKEFEGYVVEQDIRLAKQSQKQLRKVEKVLNEGPIPTNSELKALLRQGMSTKEVEN